MKGQRGCIQTKPVIAPYGSIRCIIARKIGDQYLVLGYRTVKASMDTFSIKIQKQWLTFLVDPTKCFMLAPVPIWWGMRKASMPHLFYDLDEASPMLISDKTGREIEAMVNEAKKLNAEFMPSTKFGDIKKREMYLQAMTAQKKPTSEFSLMTIVLVVVAGLAGFFAGAAINPFHTVTAVTSVTTATVTSAVETLTTTTTAFTTNSSTTVTSTTTSLADTVTTTATTLLSTIMAIWRHWI